MESSSEKQKVVAAEASERLVLLVEPSASESERCKAAIQTQSHLYGVEVVRTGEDTIKSVPEDTSTSLLWMWTCPTSPGATWSISCTT